MAEVAKDVANRKGSGSAKELFEFIKKVCTGQECVPGRNVYRAGMCTGQRNVWSILLRGIFYFI